MARANLVALTLAVVPLSVTAQDLMIHDLGSQDRYWISREHISDGIDNCREGDCPRYSAYTTRLFNPASRDQLRRLMSLLDFQAAANGQPIEHPNTPQFCSRALPPVDQVIWNPEWMKMSDKLEALRGLEGVFIDVSGLKAPEGYEGEFGADLQKELETRFTAAGIRLVSKEDVEFVPGQPKLSVFFSATNPDSGCWWSVFASMTQTAILTRDINVKLSVGSWAFMKGFDPDNLEGTEYDAITEVFDKFVDDFRAANDPEFVPVNVPPYVALNGVPMTGPEVNVLSYDEIVEQGLIPEVDETAEPETKAKPTKPAPKEEFELGATKPELTPKSLARMKIEQGLDADVLGLDDAGPSEKITTTGAE